MACRDSALVIRHRRRLNKLSLSHNINWQHVVKASRTLRAAQALSAASRKPTPSVIAARLRHFPRLFSYRKTAADCNANRRPSTGTRQPNRVNDLACADKYIHLAMRAHSILVSTEKARRLERCCN